MAESVYKVIELVGTSSEGWEQAVAAAVTRASQSVRDLRIAEVSELDVQIDAFRTRALGHVEFPYVYLDATYVKARDTDLHQVVSRAVVIATGINAQGRREVLGGDAALRELLDRAHDRGMRVVLDGVFNHTGRGFWPFHHILEAGAASPYSSRCRCHACRSLAQAVPQFPAPCSAVS